MTHVFDFRIAKNIRKKDGTSRNQHYFGYVIYHSESKIRSSLELPYKRVPNSERIIQHCLNARRIILSLCLKLQPE